MCRRTEEVRPTVGLPRHRHFVGLSNVQVQAPTLGQPFYGYLQKKPSHFSQLLLRAWGYGGPIFILNPSGLHGGVYLSVFLFIILIAPTDTWSCPIWDLHFVLMLRPFFPELVISTDLLSFEHPSVLLFCLNVFLFIILI